MTQHERGMTSAPSYTRFMKPGGGVWTRELLNLLLRVSTKWRHGLQVDIPKLRGQMAKLDRQAPRAILAEVRRENVDCDGVRAQWLSHRGSRPERVLLYIHGGAFVAYTADMYASMAASWCKPLEARALLVDYGLAPEHPYPTALENCLTAYQWLLDQGVAPGNIVVAGDSAGGNLALAMLQHLKSANKPLPSCAALLSPFLDFTLSGASGLYNARRDPMFTLAFAVAIRGYYAPAEMHSHPSVSPLFGDFSGLPPLLLQVGSTEMLLDDATRAAARAFAAGVQVQLEVWERLPHVFQMIAALPQAREAERSIISFVNRHTGWTGAPRTS